VPSGLGRQKLAWLWLLSFRREGTFYMHSNSITPRGFPYGASPFRATRHLALKAGGGRALARSLAALKGQDVQASPSRPALLFSPTDSSAFVTAVKQSRR